MEVLSCFLWNFCYTIGQLRKDVCLLLYDCLLHVRLLTFASFFFPFKTFKFPISCVSNIIYSTFFPLFLYFLLVIICLVLVLLLFFLQLTLDLKIQFCFISKLKYSSAHQVVWMFLYFNTGNCWVFQKRSCGDADFDDFTFWFFKRWKVSAFTLKQFTVWKSNSSFCVQLECEKVSKYSMSVASWQSCRWQCGSSSSSHRDKMNPWDRCPRVPQ